MGRELLFCLPVLSDHFAQRIWNIFHDQVQVHLVLRLLDANCFFGGGWAEMLMSPHNFLVDWQNMHSFLGGAVVGVVCWAHCIISLVLNMFCMWGVGQGLPCFPHNFYSFSQEITTKQHNWFYFVLMDKTGWGLLHSEIGAKLSLGAWFGFREILAEDQGSLQRAMFCLTFSAGLKNAWINFTILQWFRSMIIYSSLFLNLLS